MKKIILRVFNKHHAPRKWGLFFKKICLISPFILTIHNARKKPMCYNKYIVSD